MASKDVVTEEVLQKLISKLEEIVNNYCHNIEEFTEDEVNSFFDGTSEEITYYQSLIIDNHKSKNFLWSSAKVAEEIANAIVESNTYTDEILSDIASISLEYVDTLPTTGESNIIYILKSTETDKSGTLNLYNATSGWTTIGDFKISMDNYYNKTEADTLLDKKANKDEVVSVDKISQTLSADTNTSDTILSTKGLQAELDKKVDKTSIATSIDSSSTDDTVPSAKVVYDNIINKNTIQPTGTIANYSSVFDWAINNIGATCGYEGNMFDDCPLNHTWGILVCIGTKVESGLKVLFCTNYNKDIYTRTIQRRKGVNVWVETSWQRLCNTSVDDVSLTHIENKIDTTYGTIHNMWYEVKNGECFVQVDILKMVINTNGETLFPAGTLPKPANNRYFCVTSYINSKSALLQVTTDGTIKCWSQADLVGYAIHDSFSYPVAEL